ncbi:MAG TPA: CAP domain-containing protein [Candidatus Limnocylindrales bacterium]|nr:CAP domain-containing protein [Candidatus Limnocylindrales bacterium]
MPVLVAGARRAPTDRRTPRSGLLLLVLLVLAPAAPVAIAAPPGGGLGSPFTTTSAVAPWLRVEVYYLRLLNCTRTGGWVLSDGRCVGYGTGRYSAYVRPVSLSAGISDRVARPYARLLAMRGLCSHTADGDPGDRLRRAGYRNWAWAENVGCATGYSNLYRAVLSFHRAFQAERATHGGHWRVLKSSRYTTVGIGVWHTSGRTRLVVDFYRP